MQAERAKSEMEEFVDGDGVGRRVEVELGG